MPPRPDTVWSIEGEKAHVVLQAALENGVRNARTAHTDYSELCMEPLDKRFDGEYDLFYHSINVMLDEIYGLLDEFPDAILFTERYVDPPSAVAPGEAGGYCDACVYAPSIKRLWVFDYKHGAGVAKAVVGNRQVKQYAAGFIFDPSSPLIEVTVDPYDIEIITLCIVQPRAFHPDGEIRAYDVTFNDMLGYLIEMDAAIKKAQEINAPLVPGDEQCQFCDAKVECPARQALMLANTVTHFASVRDVIPGRLPDLTVMTPEDFAWGSYAFPLISKYIKEFYERRNELMRAGYKVPGFKLVEADAKREWYGDPVKLAKQVSAMSGVPETELFAQKFITLTEAEKLVVTAARKLAKRGSKDQAAEDARKAFALLVDKKSTGNWTVVEETDPRPSVLLGAENFTAVAGLIAPPTGD